MSSTVSRIMSRGVTRVMSPAATSQLQLVRNEIRLQLRNGFYAAYTVMTAMFFVILVALPAGWREAGFTVIVLMDPAFMGFFFAGGLVLLEREQGVLAFVLTRGRGFTSYWFTKVGAILALAFLVVGVLWSLSVVLGYIPLDVLGVLYLAGGLLLSVPAFFSLGMVMAGWKPRIIEYFVYSSIALLPLVFPLVELGGITVGLWGMLSPVWGGLVLIGSMFEQSLTALELGGAVVSLVVWNVLAYRWAGRAFARLAGIGADARPKSRPLAPKAAGSSSGAAGAGSLGQALEASTLAAGASGRGVLSISPAAADIRLMLRDRVSMLILAAPLLAEAVLGRGLPWLLHESVSGGAAALPAAVGAAVLPFMDNIRSFALLLGVLMYGMVGAFLILDEKDGGGLPFLRTLPGKPGWFILRRGRLLLLLHAVALPATVLIGGLYHGGPLRFAVSLVVDAAALPAMFLAMGLLASNKVQGLAMAKVLNICTLPPLLLIALPDSWAWVVGIFPTAWGSLIRLSATGPTQVAVAALIGLVYTGGLVAVLYRKAVLMSG
ncbi:MAG: ABC transporter permease [Spirochaeta sp.]|nr:ABC transporter permease [Spirochaeta sp.]